VAYKLHEIKVTNKSNVQQRAAARIARAHLEFCKSLDQTVIVAVLEAELMWHLHCVLN